MSLITETEPHDPDWIQREQERELRKAIGDELYEALEEVIDGPTN